MYGKEWLDEKERDARIDEFGRALHKLVTESGLDRETVGRMLRAADVIAEKRLPARRDD
jgi:hypothetical protein